MARKKYAALNDELLKIAKRELAGLGDTYYDARIKSKKMFSDAEIDIANWCEENLDEGARILEVGCGIGQLCNLLSSIGFKVVGVDPAADRIDAAKRISKKLALKVDYICDHYPDTTPKHDLLVVGNVISGWWAAQSGTEEDKIERFFTQPALISPKEWFTTKERERNAKECDALADDFTVAGRLVEPVSKLVWRIT